MVVSRYAKPVKEPSWSNGHFQEPLSCQVAAIVATQGILIKQKIMVQYAVKMGRSAAKRQPRVFHGNQHWAGMARG